MKIDMRKRIGLRSKIPSEIKIIHRSNDIGRKQISKLSITLID